MIKLTKEDYDILCLIKKKVIETNKIQSEFIKLGYRKTRMSFSRKFNSLKIRGLIGIIPTGRINQVYLTSIGKEYIKFYKRIQNG